MTRSQIPNLLTLSRIALVPVLILRLHADDYVSALAVFVLAGVTDAVDGFLAKRFGWTSHLGAVLDPAADKLLLVSAYVMLTLLGQLPFWLTLTVVSRDLFIVGGYLLYTANWGPVKMRPSALSKLNTFLQLTLIAVVLFDRAFDAGLVRIVEGLAVAVLVSTLVSGAHYFRRWILRKDVQAENSHP